MIGFLAYSAWLVYVLTAIWFARALMAAFGLPDQNTTFSGLVESVFALLFSAGLIVVTLVAGAIAAELFPGFRLISPTWQIVGLDRNGVFELAIVDLALLGWTSLIIMWAVRGTMKQNRSGALEEGKSNLLDGRFNLVVSVLSAIASILTIISVLIQRKW